MPDAMSSACASSGIMPNEVRPEGAHACKAAHPQRGSATVSASEETAAAAERRKQTLHADETAHQSADCMARTKNAGRKSRKPAPGTAAASHLSGMTEANQKITVDFYRFLEV